MAGPFLWDGGTCKDRFLVNALIGASVFTEASIREPSNQNRSLDPPSLKTTSPTRPLKDPTYR